MPSTLYQAVASAIAPWLAGDNWEEPAAAAVRVCLAEATRVVGAIPVTASVPDDTLPSGVRDIPRVGERVRAEALAALAALAEEQA